MSSPHPSFVTPGEYLELERKSEIRSEYVAGRIYVMSGASRRHNLIAGNLFREISAQLRSKPCEAYVGDMRVKVGPTGMYTYPDIVAVCDEPRFEDSFIDTLLNPAVLVEVLSESTEAYDRGEKFAHYRRLVPGYRWLLGHLRRRLLGRWASGGPYPVSWKAVHRTY